MGGLPAVWLCDLNIDQGIPGMHLIMIKLQGIMGSYDRLQFPFLTHSGRDEIDNIRRTAF